MPASNGLLHADADGLLGPGQSFAAKVRQLSAGFGSMACFAAKVRQLTFRPWAYSLFQDKSPPRTCAPAAPPKVFSLSCITISPAFGIASFAGLLFRPALACRSANALTPTPLEIRACRAIHGAASLLFPAVPACKPAVGLLTPAALLRPSLAYAGGVLLAGQGSPIKLFTTSCVHEF